MSRGFFSASEVKTKKPTSGSLIPKCGACGLYKGCNSPKMPVTGEGRKGILFIAEAPGEEEDRHNEQLIGEAGRLLRSVLLELDIDLDLDCWKTNAIICRPPGNRTPTEAEVDYCRPNVTKAIRELKPRIVIPLGGVAVRSLLAPYWRDNIKAISPWVGWQIPSQAINAWIAPTFHPSYVKRSEDNNEGPVVKLWFKRHLENAVSLRGRPWDRVPNYVDEVEVIKDTDKAARYIRKMIEKGGPVAFDYETNRLKPDPDNGEIVCCSVCWKGKKTIAYPWHGKAVEATAELLRSELPKWGANTKFEDRWSRAKLGVAVNNWQWDSMLSAHHLDNRRGITSVKFQAFVRLGQAVWDAHIKPFLETANAEGLNRIHEIDLRSLLLYCGLDSLMEYKICELQRIEAGFQIEEMKNG